MIKSFRKKGVFDWVGADLGVSTHSDTCGLAVLAVAVVQRKEGANVPGFRAPRAWASPKTWHIWSLRSLGVGRRRERAKIEKSGPDFE